MYEIIKTFKLPPKIGLVFAKHELSSYITVWYITVILNAQSNILKKVKILSSQTIHIGKYCHATLHTKWKKDSGKRWILKVEVGSYFLCSSTMY